MSNKILTFSINPEDIIKCKEFTNKVVNQTYNRFNKGLKERKKRIFFGKIGETIFFNYLISLNKKIELLNYGASNNSGNILFNENIESSSSSINELNKNSNYYKKKFFLLNFLGLNEVTKKIEIKVVTLSDFILENNINKIDLLKIDTEGHEFQVLSGLKDKMHMINLIHIEHHFDDMIIKDYKLTDIHNLLEKKGFKKYFKIKMRFRKSFEYLYININYNS